MLPVFDPLIYEAEPLPCQPDDPGVEPARRIPQHWLDDPQFRAALHRDHRPDDPGGEPPAMRSPFSPLEDDGPEPSSSDRRTVTVICCLIALAAAVGLIAVVSLGAS